MLHATLTLGFVDGDVPLGSLPPGVGPRSLGHERLKFRGVQPLLLIGRESGKQVSNVTDSTSKHRASGVVAIDARHYYRLLIGRRAAQWASRR